MAQAVYNNLPKIIKIQQRLLELQRKMFGVFFIETQCTVFFREKVVCSRHSRHESWLNNDRQ